MVGSPCDVKFPQAHPSRFTISAHLATREYVTVIRLFLRLNNESLIYYKLFIFNKRLKFFIFSIVLERKHESNIYIKQL